MNEIIEKKSMPKWIKIGILIAGAILIVVGLFKIFGNDTNVLVNKFNEVQAPNAVIKNDLISVSNILLGIGAKETNKDYTGIVSDLQTIFVKLDDAEVQIASTSAPLTELQGIIDSSSDQSVKITGTRFIDVFKLKNVAQLKMISDTRDFVNQAITFYNEMAQNKKITIDVKKFNATVSTLGVNAQSMTDIGVQYEVAANDFAKAAGFIIESK